MEFNPGDIVKTFNKYYFIENKKYDDWWKEYSYQTMECGFNGMNAFILTMKPNQITPGSDGHKKMQPGKKDFFDCLFTEKIHISAKELK